MRTEEAFIEMLKEKNLAKKLGILKCSISIWRGVYFGKYKEKHKIKPPSKQLMEKLLLKYGAKIESNESWKI